MSAENSAQYKDALSGNTVKAKDGRIQITVPANSGMIMIPSDICNKVIEPVKTIEIKKIPEPEKAEKSTTEKTTINLNKPYEEMTVPELQEAILEKMRKNGPVTKYMLGTVRENTHLGSLLNWVRSFN